MAQFKPGDRVRVRTGAGINPETAGREATYGGPDPLQAGGCYVYMDHRPSEQCWGWESDLEPLTPPAADTWAADKVRRVTKPQHIEPVVPPAKVVEELRALDRALRGIGVSIFRNL